MAGRGNATLHGQGSRKRSAWQRAKRGIRNDLLNQKSRKAYYAHFKPVKSHRFDKSPFSSHFDLFGKPDQFAPQMKVLAVLFLVLAGSVGGYFWYTDPSNGLFHSQIPQQYCTSTVLTNCVGDPSNLIAQFAGNNMNGYNFQNAAVSGGFLTLAPNSTFPAIVVSKSQVDLSSANSREVVFDTLMGFTATVNTASFDAYQYYLTTNASSTVSNSPSYNPLNDKSVVFDVGMGNCGMSGCEYDVFMTNNATGTLSGQNFGGCLPNSSVVNGCPTVAMHSNSGQDQDTVMLNYTGVNAANSAGQNGVSCGAFGNLVGGSNECASVDFAGSSFAFRAQTANTWRTYPRVGLGQYHLGFFVKPTSTGTINVAFESNIAASTGDAMDIINFLPSAAITTPPAPIQGGGFFQPLVNLLIQAGVFILQNIILFGTYLSAFFWPIFTAVANGLWALVTSLATSLEGVLVAAVNVFEALVKSLLNTIGQTFGFPASSNCNFSTNPAGCGLGDDLFQDITYLITLITTTVASFIGGLTNIFTALLNFFSAITTWFTTWGGYFLNAILAIANLASEAITVVKNLLLYAPSTFTWGAIILFIVYSSLDGLDGWYSYFETMGWLLLFGISIAEKILNWLISTSVWIVSQIPMFQFEAEAATFGGGVGGKYMVGFDLPRLPLLEHNFHPGFPHNFTDPEIARFNIFSILGLVVGTFMLIYAVGANLVPGVSAANSVNLSLINALLPIGLVLIGAFGAVMLPFLLGYLFRNVFGIQVVTPSVGLELSKERIPLKTGKVKGPGFKFGLSKSKHKLQVRTQDGKSRTVKGIRNIIAEGKRQSAASQERLRRETERLRQDQLKAQKQREREAEQRAEQARTREENRQALGRTSEGFE